MRLRVWRIYDANEAKAMSRRGLWIRLIASGLGLGYWLDFERRGSTMLDVGEVGKVRGLVYISTFYFSENESWEL